MSEKSIPHGYDVKNKSDLGRWIDDLKAWNEVLTGYENPTKSK